MLHQAILKKVFWEVNLMGPNFHNCSSDVPDIILRDPPGSNSFTSIEKVKRLVSQKEASLMQRLV
jgi:hypothetical protein